ncbi:MAG: hypothetical protein DID92_2727744355 [Candidatus Nitrotoga sp. SPKER]|nr:MAG: hypothetical protein DID92_2727744355 [Candidatus Nitrotoga sp. SPKER]
MMDFRDSIQKIKDVVDIVAHLYGRVMNEADRFVKGGDASGIQAK